MNVVTLEDVVSAGPNPNAVASLKGFRASGARLPGVITAGTYRTRGSKEFWDDGRDPEHILVITLKDAEFARLVIDVADSAKTAGQKETALTRRLQPNT